MKLKKDSLFEKIKRENIQNNSSKINLERIRDYDKSYSSNSVLREKLIEVISLLENENLDDNLKANKILNEEFVYTYPFYCEVNNSNDYNSSSLLYYEKSLSKSTLSSKDVLLNHIITEQELNRCKLNYNNSMEIMSNLKRLTTGYWFEKYKFFIWLGIIALIWLLFGLRSIYHLIWTVPLSWPLSVLLYGVFIHPISKSKAKDEIKRLNIELQKIKSIQSRIKTKAITKQ